MENVRPAVAVVRTEERITQSQLVTKCGSRGFFREKTVGTRFDDKTIHRLGLDNSAEATLSFDQKFFNRRSVPPRLREHISGRESRDAATQDGDASPSCIRFRHWAHRYSVPSGDSSGLACREISNDARHDY